MYVMYYFTIITSLMILRDDPGETTWPCLRARGHNWYQSITGIKHHLWSYFQKYTVRKHIDARIRNIVVLKGGNLTGLYFLHLLSRIYCLVTTHQ
jgi:hypothetical protein